MRFHIVVCDNVQEDRIFGHLAIMSLRSLAVAYQGPLFAKACLAQVDQGTHVGRRILRARHCYPERPRLESRSATAQAPRPLDILHAAGTLQRNCSSVGRARRWRYDIDLRNVQHLRQRSRRGCPTAGKLRWVSDLRRYRPIPLPAPSNISTISQRACALCRGLAASPESYIATYVVAEALRLSDGR